MIRVEKSSPLIGLLLSLVILSPQFFLATPTIQTQPTIISVDEYSAIKTLTAFNITIDVQKFVRTEKWSNSTKVHVSVFIPNGRGYFDVRVNCTKWINVRGATIETERPIVSGPLPNYIEDGWVWFLPWIENETHWTSHSHNDNYNAYYVAMWDYPYNIQGESKNGIHLIQSLLNAWINGNITGTQAVIWKWAIGAGLDVILDELGVDVVGGIAVMFGIPAIYALIVKMGLLVYEVLETIVQLMGFISTINWLKEVVMEKFAGDGWTWMGPISVLDTYIWWWVPYSLKPYTEYDYYKTLYWQQSYGAEGIFSISQHEYTAEVWYNRVVKAGPTSAHLPAEDTMYWGP